MNEALIDAWNSRVGHVDEVYHLGDVSFMNTKATKEILGRLNGKIYLLLGNHDKGIRGEVAKRFEWIKHYHELAHAQGEPRIILMHYSFRVWNKSHFGAWSLYGHSHDSLPFIGRQMDVGVDTREDHAPWSLEEIAKIMEERPFQKVDYHGTP
jgi:calcineurin-like phosphoesterase family protein